MTDRATVIAKITAVAELQSGAAPGTLDPTVPLHGQAYIDSLDVVQIAIDLEDQLVLPGGAIDPKNDWSIERFADAVVAAKAREAA